MLESISIQNYALIEQLNIDLSKGLNVITGETGAGKSIVINALSLLLGNRASKGNIRKDSKKMTVSGQFSVQNKDSIKEVLDKFGIETEDNELILTREVDKNGKNVCRINGVIVPLSSFRELGNHLIDIHSQHEHVALFKSDHQRDLLDLYGGEELVEKRDLIKEIALKLKELAGKIRDLQISTKEANRNHATNLFELEEIRKANLSKDEEEELLEKEKELARQEKLFTESYQAQKILNSQSENENSIDSLLSDLSEQISRLSQIDPFFNKYNEEIESLIDGFSSLSFDLNNYFNNLEFNPEEMDQVQKRLSLIQRLKSQYGETIGEILEFADELQEKIDLFDNADLILDETKKEYKTVRNDYNIQASELTKLRNQAALKLKEELENELKDLAMDKAQVKIEIKTDSDLISLTGQDSVDFLISVNPGLPPKALKQVASGGEISRIMLAIKGIFGEKDQIETLIFDEIDTGISGRTAQVVAEKILKLSTKRQIICITHLPQIAAMADNQYVVQKKSSEDSTEVTFNQLTDEQRAEELARMLSGAKTTDLTLKNANEMLEQALLLKNNFN